MAKPAFAQAQPRTALLCRQVLQDENSATTLFDDDRPDLFIGAIN